jgi:hypothetical protein
VGKIKQKMWQIKKGIGARRREYLAARPHKSFRKTRLPRTQPSLITIKQNTAGTLALLWRERWLFCKLSLLYAVVTYIFVGGVAQADFVSLKEATVEVFGGSFTALSTVFSLLSSTMSGAFSGTLTELQQFLSLFLAILFWLTIVWALRMQFAQQPFTARDAIYSSATPLVAFLVVGFFVILQLTPGAIGLFIFNVAQGGGYLHNGVEVMAFAAVAILLCALSIYWLAGSLTALVVVTLPQMYPWKAIRIAGELVIFRRVRMVGHILALGIFLLIAWAAVLLPVLLLDSWLRWEWLPLVPIFVQALSAFTLVYLSAYVYKLYRSML